MFGITVKGSQVSVWTDKGGNCVSKYNYNWWPTTGPYIYWQYFKAGSYCQDNSQTVGTGCLVGIANLTTSHNGISY